MCFRDNITHLKHDHPGRFIALLIVAHLVMFAIPIYFLQNDIKESIEYHQRDNYKFVTSIGTNTTYYYYIIRQNATIQNCSSNSRFSQNLTITYDYVVSHGPENIYFIIPLWLNLGVVVFLMLFKIYSVGRDIYSIKSKHHTITHKKPALCKLVIDKIRQESWTHATLSAATFFATIFDYSDICLNSLSDAEIYALTYVGLTILLPVVALIWILVAIGCTKCAYAECKSDCGLLDVDPITKKINCRGNKCFGTVIKCVIWLAFVVNAPAHIIGIIIWFVMIISQRKRIDAILILINTIMTITIEIYLED